MRLFGTNVVKLKGKGDVAGLIRALSHKDWSVRIDAAKALGELGDERALEPLITLLSEAEKAPMFGKVEMQGGGFAAAEPGPGLLGPSAAAEAIMKIAQGSAARLSTVLSTTHSTSLKVDAAAALARSGDRRGVGALVELLMKHEDWEIRRRIAEALGEVGDARAAVILEPLAKDWHREALRRGETEMIRASTAAERAVAAIRGRDA